MGATWERKSSRTVYDNPWIRVVEYDVIRPDGAHGTYAVVETKAQAVTIVAVREPDQICLIEEYRFPINKTLWRLPMGGAGQERQPSLDAAKAELREETGLNADAWQHVGNTVTMSGLSQEFAHVYLATSLSKVSPVLDRDIRQIRFFSIPELADMMRTGQLIDGQSLSAFTLAVVALGFHFTPSSKFPG